MTRRRGLLAGAKDSGDALGVNLVDWSKITEDYYLDKTGDQQPYKGWFYSNYIPIDPSGTYEYYKSANYWYTIHFYDADKNRFTDLSDPVYQAGTITIGPDRIPTNTAYIRFTSATDQSCYFKRIA